MASNKNDKNLFTFSSGKIAEDFGVLLPDHFYHYINNGQWSLHELLEFVLKYTGPAEVKVTSFSLSETAIRAFVRLMEECLITRLDCLFDVSTKRNKLDLLIFAQNVSPRVFLSSNHAKIISVKSARTHVFINTSANLTVNRRHESGIIITNKIMAAQYAAAIEKVFDSAILLNLEQ
ncbi:MAG: hypothetical protein K0B15_06520 [Lentimicrobium sp.]|nr:hypothetical protein [Lentimicrobium sp.]